MGELSFEVTRTRLIRSSQLAQHRDRLVSYTESPKTLP